MKALRQIIERVREKRDQAWALATILRARYCDPRIRSLTKTDSLTFRVKEILQEF